MRSWCIDNLLNYSIAHANSKLTGDAGLFIGIAQNISRDMEYQSQHIDGMVALRLAPATLEAMKSGNRFTYEGKTYVLKK